jgi:predicted esterase
MQTHHTIQVSRTGHYFTLGSPGTHIRQFWIVCHGYAQLADAFIQNFEEIDDGSRLIVAPEGLNHAYRRGFDGDVVANWMTRRYREYEIEDYSHYLQKIYDHYLPQLPSDVRIVLLGFSQGTATVCRWMMRMQPVFHDLLLWSGLPPEDLNYHARQDYLSDKNLYLLYGTTDPFLTPDRIASVQDLEANHGIDFDEQPFEGGHEIPTERLMDILNRIG